jgi:chromosome segregation ATPase
MRNRIATVLLAIGLVPACKGDRSDPNEAQKVIEEVQDEAAETRNQIQQKQEDVVEDSNESAQDRAAFIDATEKELADLDRRIQELRADVQTRSSGMKGEDKRDLSQSIAELETTRNEARSAFDRFKTSTGAEMTQVQQVTQEALIKLRRALESADSEIGTDSEIPPPQAP